MSSIMQQDYSVGYVRLEVLLCNIWGNMTLCIVFPTYVRDDMSYCITDVTYHTAVTNLLNSFCTDQALQAP